jgi:hypothetical protein
VQQAVADARASGIDVVHITRGERLGFKAGALAFGLTQNSAPFVAIFDADFQPRPDFLKRAIIPLLANDRLAFVQGRWDHVNRYAKTLTAAQALGIDCHFAIEQGARAWNNLTLNFNGTCGMWRRRAIDDAGGWHHDTLTEDMDLSYRAQLRGWQGTYRGGLAVPGELPATLGAWRSQQFRWAKGSLQTMVKLAGPVLRSSWSWPRRIAALLHLSHYLIHPLILMSVVCAPLALLAVPYVPTAMIAVMIGCFVLGAGAPFILYTSSQIVLHGWRGLKHLRALPLLTAMGTGIAVSNSVAAWQALRGITSPFIRTPKQGTSTGSYRSQAANGWPELIVAVWSISGLIAGFTWSHAWVSPLLWLYTGGFAWIGWRTLRESGQSDKDFRLLGIALLSIAGYSFLASLPYSWRDLPVTFAVVGVLLGGLYLLAVGLITSSQHPNGKRPSLLFIITVAVIMRLVCLGLTPSDDLARYAIEGQQILAGENPYSIAPGVSAVAAAMPAIITNPLNHGDWTAIYPPLAITYHTVVGFIAAEPIAYKLAALVCEVLAMWLIVLLLQRQHLPTTLLLLAAWNPIGPLFITGEGHHDIVMVVFLLTALVWTAHGFGRSIFAMSCAALVKPFAVVALIPLLLQRRWSWWLLPPLIAVLSYLPFATAGLGVVDSLGRFASTMHFHGALEPFIREVWSWMVPATAVRAYTVITLIALLISAVCLILRASLTVPITTLLIRLFAVLLLCLPTMHPWYFMVVVSLLPFTRSYGLLAWTALAPVAVQSWPMCRWVKRLTGAPETMPS